MVCNNKNLLFRVLTLIGISASFILALLYRTTYHIQHRQGMIPCPTPQRMLDLGRINVSKYRNIFETDAIRNNPSVETGGFWKPPSCVQEQKVAIIVPFRNREQHLWLFLNHMHQFLQKQLRGYGIYIIEQTPRLKFNRAMLLNIGYLEASKDQAWDSFVFHDVDLLPTNTRNIYSCSKHPRHMSVAVDTLQNKLYYEGQFGGVSCMSKNDFVAVNGFSNVYFGWGGEDDDIATRMDVRGLRRVRYPPQVSRYVMLSHKPEGRPQKENSMLHYTKSLMDHDGISSIKYTVLASVRHPLFTKITVDFEDNAHKFLSMISEMKFKKVSWKPNHKTNITYEKMEW